MTLKLRSCPIFLLFSSCFYMTLVRKKTPIKPIIIIMLAKVVFFSHYFYLSFIFRTVYYIANVAL